MFVKPDGSPLKILVRGDCTCRRSLALNPDLFAAKPTVVQNGKSPMVLFLDALDGRTVSKEFLASISDVDAMQPTLQRYYIGQADREVVNETGADLLMLDSYADMNFELWEDEAGAKFWIHPAHLRDRDSFIKRHRKLGRRTLDQSVNEAVELIVSIRRKNPGVPVLFLNQQTDYYPKLDNRLEYYDFGRLVAERVDGVYWGGVEPKDALELADIGSCGPGNTLHFQGSTYRRMLERAFDSGLRAALAGASASQAPSAPAATATVTAADKAGPVGDVEIPHVTLSFSRNSRSCGEACTVFVDQSEKGLANYLHYASSGDFVARRFTPMLIPVDEVLDFAGWEAHIKTFGKGARLRQKKKAIAQNYYVKPFAWRLFIPDIHAANTSKEIRSGGAIRPTLTRSIEEMGGAPDRRYEVALPKCQNHWAMTFGVFQAAPGHMQGSVQVDERLVGYISLRRTGEVAVYSQILGHGDHLDHGILTLLHHEVIRWLSEHRESFTRGLKYVMYGGKENGTSELLRFKRQAGFRPHYVTAMTQ
ncbi:hypothetical protein [Lysobacter sp. Root494]|uniref:hypothetical protein n=1 Tax=Lysobacter sp. Root494 TaxID=1736549 RepID=UPI0006FAAB28|nr:hypothetical protein [Lysobacter sp. Root494]KQY49815.1 hypothetical protein ASD14_13930 [Lysobacter sp. Root494]